ncbi:MAG: DNA glycosylase [Lachnospiraceae bacterium]|nr:N-glycosylase [Lachnospiraceae bacterium]MDY2956090.1 DNA glycosylase [Lachnospiraceae bacterium]
MNDKGYNPEVISLDNNIIIKNIEDFDLKETLECGQCFHFLNTEESDNNYTYLISSFNRGLKIEQKNGDLIFHDTTVDEYNSIWKEYFDLDRDYKSIKKEIGDASPELRDIIEKNSGIRLLNQDFFETLISFIISQNNQIPRIKKLVNDISEKWGSKSFSYIDNIYNFPDAGTMDKVTEEELRELKTGFRAPYIVDAVSRFNSGEINEEELRQADTAECEKKLCIIRGVGNKVANCVMLFSLGKRDSFPIDVWMKRVLEQVYFNGEEKSKEYLFDFSKDKFGSLGGYAQQYLFAFARGIR